MSEEDVPKIPADGPGLRYMAVADHIAGMAEKGKLRPGSRLPPERELAEDYGVSYMTVRRAMKELRERGVVVSVHGKGTFVTEQPAG
ncbi:GntR family transcriptional regulator [Nocardiopsis xinjiangensis]|uniref:GntR family transcriptional regulator n=1 Tax=Nocardiopsis xinjiangensis TaxID=124285 RepID=UPI000526EA7E|nr:winged helix-turn-helix domain-containing protein [Nocardiopsis xinjiangensis]